MNATYVELTNARRAFLDADPLDVPAYDAAQKRLTKAKEAARREDKERTEAEIARLRD